MAHWLGDGDRHLVDVDVDVETRVTGVIGRAVGLPGILAALAI